MCPEPPAATLASLSVGSDMLVVGRRGMGIFKRLLIGSTSALRAISEYYPDWQLPHHQPPRAAPCRLSSTGEQTSGALLALFDGSPPPASPAGLFTGFLTQWRASASPTWLPLLLAILALGTATGLLLSGRLIRRLRAITETVRSWSRGDLSGVADAKGQDELSSLAADLNHMAEQLRNLLAARNDLATAQERHRVRRELHDGVKQELFAASMHLAAASASLTSAGTGTGAIAQLENAQQSTRRAQGELAAIINQEPPPTLSNSDLPTALTLLAADFEQRAAVTLMLTVPTELPLQREIQQALYRVAQEALSNIQRHAGARTEFVKVVEASGSYTAVS
jgi:signal transduction histidine kinase